MALDGARGQRARRRPDRTESDPVGRRSPARAEPAGEAPASEVLDEFAAVLKKMAADAPFDAVPPDECAQEADLGVAAPVDETAPGEGESAPGDIAPASPIGTYRYGVTDLDGRPVTYAIVRPPEGGRVIDNGGGAFGFDPGSDFRDLPAGETRDVSFTYQASDGAGATATATVTLTVTGGSSGPASAGGDAVEEDALREADGVETIHLDGVSGPPGVGGWTIALNKGEILETNEDNLLLSDDAVGVIILGSDTGEIFFESIDRIEW